MVLNDEQGGGFRFYSLGIVVKDKEVGSDVIEVCPIEDFPLELGMLDKTRQRKSEVKEISGVTKSEAIEGKPTVRALWVPLSNPNRDNSPDVYRSETVKLYKYADTQDYYWSTLFREPSLRGRERVRVSLSNKDAGGDPYGEDTSYWVEYDTRNKHVMVHTSSNDGEPTSYDLKIDTAAGTVEIVDELGNFIRLESVAGHLDVTTANSITHNTKDYTVNASESFTINTKRYTIEASESMTETTKELTTAADQTTLNGTDYVINSRIEATKGLNLGGDNGSGTTGTFTGDFKVIGNIRATGTIIDEGGNTPNHSH